MIKEAIFKLGKHSFIYGLGNIGTKIIAIVLLPLYTAYLTPADYGVLQICNVLSSIIVTIIVMGSSSALFKVYYEDKNEENRRIILGTTVIFYIISAALLLIPLIILRKSIAPILIGGEQSNYLLVLVIFAAYLEGLISLGLAILRANEKSVTYAIFSIVRLIIYIGLNICFVAVLHRNYIGVKEATLIALIISFIVIFILTYKKIRWKFNRNYIKDILIIGIPLAIGGLASWVLNMTDRYMLKFLLPENIALIQVGLYSLGAKIASFIHFILVAPFMLSWGALMYSYQNDPHAKQIYRSVLNIFAIIAGILFLFISFFSPEIINLIAKNKDYLSAYKVVPYLAFSKVLFGVYMVFTVGVTLTRNTKYITLANTIAALLNIGLNFLFIPYYGMMGAAVASLISFIVRTVILYYYAQKNYFIPFEIIRITGLLLILLSIGIVQNYLSIHYLIKIILFILIIFSFPLTGLVKYSQIVSFLKILSLRMFRIREK
jgi:O-antigen/teichoic acid export membrane protein